MSMTPLSVFIYGNTNNYPYLLAEGFRALGHAVKLVINKKELLHRPESLHPEWLNAYPEWIIDASDIGEFDIAFESQKLDELFATHGHQADFAVLNDIGPALAGYLHCPYATVLTGSDLTYYANYQSVVLRTAAWDPGFRRTPYARRIVRKFTDLVTRQREGILMSSVVSYGARNLTPEGDVLLDEIGVLDAQRFMVHLSNTLHTARRHMPKNERLKIFCGSRVVWKQNAQQSYCAMDLKGTDVLINGFAAYCRQGGKGVLHLPRKGTDVEDAVTLIAELGIESRVVWYENMSLKQFEEELISADLICDQFGSSFPGMVTTHAYALGRPVLANFRPDLMPFAMPGLHAETAEQVREQLLKAERDYDDLTNLGAVSRAFAEATLSPSAMAKELLERAGLVVAEVAVAPPEGNDQPSPPAFAEMA